MALTTNEQAFIDEIVARGGILVETRETYDPVEDVILVEILGPLADAGVADDPAGVAAALEDMGVTVEEVADWEW